MAERIQVELVDDIDGSPAQHTVTFALDGVSYEIDLSERHAKELRSLFARYIERSRGKEQRVSRDTREQEREQEREERETRQVNKQLTEQIRGAAQRTKERLNKKTESESAKAAGRADKDPQSAQQAESVKPDDPSQEPEKSHSREPQSQEPQDSEQESGRVPAVSLPQFSSAVE